MQTTSKTEETIWFKHWTHKTNHRKIFVRTHKKPIEFAKIKLTIKNTIETMQLTSTTNEIGWYEQGTHEMEH